MVKPDDLISYNGVLDHERVAGVLTGRSNEDRQILAETARRLSTRPVSGHSVAAGLTR